MAKYRQMNPGQTADLQSDISGLGDGYARTTSRWAKVKHLAEAGLAVVREDMAAITYHHVLLADYSVIMTAPNQVESLLLTSYSTGLWGRSPAFQKHEGVSSIFS
ncbi:hypothetical protein [Falsirhodobacter deserti]|uniref:hypothetical protein n=1 Tax=Falsirhodobacter deserti TaxID=1365611 RepID=UPI000FE324C1|nr:hypothetical protein [Falsirhodobacter deserti]